MMIFCVNTRRKLQRRKVYTDWIIFQFCVFFIIFFLQRNVKKMTQEELDFDILSNGRKINHGKFNTHSMAEALVGLSTFQRRCSDYINWIHSVFRLLRACFFAVEIAVSIQAA